MTDENTPKTPGMSEATAKFEPEAEAAVNQAPPPDGPKVGARSIAALLKEYLHGYTMYALMPTDVTDKVNEQRYGDHYEIMHELEQCKPSNLDEGADLLLFARHALMREIGDQMERLDEDPHCPIFQVVAAVETLLREIVLAEPAPEQGEATTGGSATETGQITQASLDQDASREDEELLNDLDRLEAARGQFVAFVKQRGDLGREIEVLQGRIVGVRPDTFVGAKRMLHMAHEILSVRDVDPGVFLGAGPATAVIAQVIAALDDKDGALERLDAW